MIIYGYFGRKFIPRSVIPRATKARDLGIGLAASPGSCCVQLQRHAGGAIDEKKLADLALICGESHRISRDHTSGGTKFMLLGSSTKHPSRSTADHISKSISCGRCGAVNYHPLLKAIRFKAFGGRKVDQGKRQLRARILRRKGVQMKNLNRINVGSSQSATFV